MYIIYDTIRYPCKCTIGSTMIYRGLPSNFPEKVSGEIILCANNGFEMRRDNTKDYARQTFKDGVLILTNEPEIKVNQVEKETVSSSAQDDIDAMLVDHEYRLTLLELGLNE